jgi:catechol 2,3-dioxygenase-like lactoylglutathione lyase family enzyme
VFDRVTIRTADRAASERFYGVLLRTLGVEETSTDARDARWADFTIRQADERAPATRGLHVGFVAPTRARVDEFWRIGTGEGYEDDGRPGVRPEYGPDYYGGFLRDPDGNSAEAVHHDDLRQGGVIDHVWIRVADVAGAKQFYATIAPHAGFRLETDLPERAQFKRDTGSFSVVDGKPTEHAHMAFAVDDDASVDAFHAAVVQAGYRSLEAPSERWAEKARAYAASALDPDGNHVEVVHHGD